MDTTDVLRFMVDPDDSLSTRIMLEIEANFAENIYEIPLMGDNIDCDALDAIFRGPNRPDSLIFHYAGRKITVLDDRMVEIEEADPKI